MVVKEQADGGGSGDECGDDIGQIEEFEPGTPGLKKDGKGKADGIGDGLTRSTGATLNNG